MTKNVFIACVFIIFIMLAFAITFSLSNNNPQQIEPASKMVSKNLPVQKEIKQYLQTPKNLTVQYTDNNISEKNVTTNIKLQNFEDSYLTTQASVENQQSKEVKTTSDFDTKELVSDKSDKADSGKAISQKTNTTEVYSNVSATSQDEPEELSPKTESIKHFNNNKNKIKSNKVIQRRSKIRPKPKEVLNAPFLEKKLVRYFFDNISFPNKYATEFWFVLDKDMNVYNIRVKSTENRYYTQCRRCRNVEHKYKEYSDYKRNELGNNKVISAHIYPFVCHKKTLKDYKTSRFKVVSASSTQDGKFLIKLYNFIKNSGTNHFYSRLHPENNRYFNVYGRYFDGRLVVMVSEFNRFQLYR